MKNISRDISRRYCCCCCCCCCGLYPLTALSRATQKPEEEEEEDDESRRANGEPPKTLPKNQYPGPRKGKQTVPASGAMRMMMTMVTTTTTTILIRERREGCGSGEKMCVYIYMYCRRNGMEWEEPTKRERLGVADGKWVGNIELCFDLYSSSLQGTPYAKSRFPILLFLRL